MVSRHDTYLKMKMSYPASGATFYRTEVQCLHPKVLQRIEGIEDKQLKIWQNLNTWEW